MSEQIPDAVRAYLSAIGSKKTEAKMKSARANLALGPASRRRDPLELPCTCGGGDVLKVKAYKTTCPRVRLLYQRERTAQQRAEKVAQVAAAK